MQNQQHYIGDEAKKKERKKKISFINTNDFATTCHGDQLNRFSSNGAI